MRWLSRKGSTCTLGAWRSRLGLSHALYTDFGVRLLALGAKTDTGAESRLTGGITVGLGASF